MGLGLGSCVGTAVGICVGFDVGSMDGRDVGSRVGLDEGDGVSGMEGIGVGSMDGDCHSFLRKAADKGPAAAAQGALPLLAAEQQRDPAFIYNVLSCQAAHVMSRNVLSRQVCTC